MAAENEPAEIPLLRALGDQVSELVTGKFNRFGLGFAFIVFRGDEGLVCTSNTKREPLVSALRAIADRIEREGA